MEKVKHGHGIFFFETFDLIPNRLQKIFFGTPMADFI